MTWIGAFVGVFGLALVFRQDLTHAFFGAGASDTIRGMLFCIAGTYVASLGNVWAVRVQTAGVDVIRSSAWGMIYGATALFLYAASQGMPLGIPMTVRYLSGLAYLAVFASVVGFLCYLTLLRRIGPSRAGYVAVVFPVVALIVSAFLENFVPGGLEKMGLGPDVLFAENPALVIVRISGWGQTGPYSHKPGTTSFVDATEIAGKKSDDGHQEGQGADPPGGDVEVEDTLHLPHHRFARRVEPHQVQGQHEQDAGHGVQCFQPFRHRFHSNLLRIKIGRAHV